MKLAILTVMLAGLTPSVLAQGLPSLEGNGSQTQSVEVGKGAISVTLESSGTIAAGGGSNSLDGAATLSVNDLSIGVGHAQDDHPTSEPGAVGASHAHQVRASADPSTGTSAPENETKTSSGAVCPLPLPSREALAAAIDQGYRLVRVAAPCPGSPDDLDALLAVSPAIVAALEAAGARRTGLVSITINNGVVTLGYDLDG